MSGLKKGFQITIRKKRPWDGKREYVSAHERQTAQDRAEAKREAEAKRARRGAKRVAEGRVAEGVNAAAD